jgi:hypothetical protein
MSTTTENTTIPPGSRDGSHLSGGPDKRDNTPYAGLDHKLATKLQKYAEAMQKALKESGTFSAEGLLSFSNALIKDAFFGCALRKLRETIDHGLIGRWTDYEFGMSRQRASEYIRISVLIDAHPDRVADIAQLSKTSRLLLAARDVPPEAIKQVLDQVFAGDVPTSSDVEQIISDHKFEVDFGPLELEPPDPTLTPRESKCFDFR